LLWFGLLGDTVWLLLHIYSLWLPYFLGASPQYAKMYARVFGRTTKLLPNFGNHLAPDAMHIFIDVSVVAVIVTLVLYLRLIDIASLFTWRGAASHNIRRRFSFLEAWADRRDLDHLLLEFPDYPRRFAPGILASGGSCLQQGLQIADP